jgi:hypothetical protein
VITGGSEVARWGQSAATCCLPGPVTCAGSGAVITCLTDP